MMTASTASEIQQAGLPVIRLSLAPMRLLRGLVNCFREPALPAPPPGLRLPRRVWQRNAALLMDVYDHPGR